VSANPTGGYLAVSDSDLQVLPSVDPGTWRDETGRIGEYLTTVGQRLGMRPRSRQIIHGHRAGRAYAWRWRQARRPCRSG
jgi:hypothetical protein